MDGLFSLSLLALPDQVMLAGLLDLGVLATSVLLALFSALALARQIISAIYTAD